MSLKHWWNDTNKRKSNYLEKYLFVCHFAHYKFQTYEMALIVSKFSSYRIKIELYPLFRKMVAIFFYHTNYTYTVCGKIRNFKRYSKS